MDFCRFLSPSASSCLTEQRHIGFRCYTDLLCGSSNWHFVKSFSAFSPSRSSNNGSCAIPSASFPGCIGVVKKIIAGESGLSGQPACIPLQNTAESLSCTTCSYVCCGCVNVCALAIPFLHRGNHRSLNRFQHRPASMASFCNA